MSAPSLSASKRLRPAARQSSASADQGPPRKTRTPGPEPASGSSRSLPSQRRAPPFAAPDFGAAPASLTQSPRGNFNLLPAGEFRGNPDPTNTDVILGASETFLDLVGHHLVTSGGLCLGVGTALIDQLNLGTIGWVVGIDKRDPTIERMVDNAIRYLMQR